MEFSAPLQGELSRKLLAVYETEGLLLRLVVVLFYNPSVIFFENATSPCRGGENTMEREASCLWVGSQDARGWSL
ncbi:MAG: hypothetical protein J6M16_02315, partial [Clostridia bacterium]|nr:hypothetical protein [Clostridia bacterium]